jgi:pilus assembly protein Flp/PilA
MKRTRKQNGQGLIEYALILVLVAVVVIAILTLLGPQVGNVFSRIVNGLGVAITDGDGQDSGNPPDPSATITAVTAWRATGSTSVGVTVSVSASTNVTIVDSQSGKTASIGCDPDCTVTLPDVGPNPGTITATAEGGSSMSASYPAAN